LRVGERAPAEARINFYFGCETMRILAIDPALHTGVADGIVGPDARPTMTTWDVSRPVSENVKRDGRPEAAFARAALRINMWIALAKPDVLAIEQPLPPHRMQGATQWATTQMLLGLYGVYTGVAGLMQVRVLPVHMQTWRKVALGKGNLDRADSKAAALKVCKLQGWAVKNDDEAEAACIWLWACGATKLGMWGDAA
jgi:hypothetical protein